jgi:pyridoxamine 5'-phosphate oxidase
MNNNNLISLNEDPIDLFTKWYEEAKKTEVNDHNAMNLATISKDNKPSSRIVLIKSFSVKGFIFYTNTLSKKGNSLENNKYVALNFHWKSLLKQIRIEGEVSKVNDNEADEYFNSRPIDSRIGAWASSQSDYLKNRSELLKKVEIIKEKFTNKSIVRPPHWTGYIVIPSLIEFWQNMPHRLHDRVEYRKTESGWEVRNLYP